MGTGEEGEGLMFYLVIERCYQGASGEKGGKIGDIN